MRGLTPAPPVSLATPHGQAGGLCPFFLPYRQSVGRFQSIKGVFIKMLRFATHLYKASPLTAFQLRATRKLLLNRLGHQNGHYQPCNGNQQHSELGGHGANPLVIQSERFRPAKRDAHFKLHGGGANTVFGKNGIGRERQIHSLGRYRKIRFRCATFVFGNRVTS